MAEFSVRNLDKPSETVNFPLTVMDMVEIGDVTVARAVHQPGWRWSTHIQPLVGGESCQVRHLMVVVSGSMGISFPDGQSVELHADDVVDIPPGHDGWVIGDEPVVLFEWGGVRAYVGHHGGLRGRVLATLLFTDLVDSTAKAASMGDKAWRQLLAEHFEECRASLERYNGREIKNTGDGIFAMFDGPALALRCAAEIRDASRASGIEMRAGVHVGEVETVGGDVRGIAVHQAARVMAAAGTGEIFVSDITRILSASAGLRFEDRGTHTLKGIDGTHPLFAFLSA